MKKSSKIYVQDNETGKILEDLGTVTYNNINGVFQMYEYKADEWACKGYFSELVIEQDQSQTQEGI